MQSQDTDNLFQSDTAQEKESFRVAKAVLHSETGSPIQLKSKPISFQVSHFAEPEAWIAESGFIVRRVSLVDGTTKQTYRGHTGPVTSIEFYKQYLLSGSWDKSFRIWDTKTKQVLSTTLAHEDFVKCLLVIPQLDIVITGSSDKTVKIWDLKTLQLTPLDSEQEMPIQKPSGAAPVPARTFQPLKLIKTLKSHTRPIEKLGFYSLLQPGSEEVVNDHFVMVSVDSMGAVKTWSIYRENDQIQCEILTETRPHETGIYDLYIGDGEIWTASADNSVLLSTFDATDTSGTLTPSLRIPHYSHVKSVHPLAHAKPHLNASYLLTGASDEHIRIIDLNLLDAPTKEKEKWAGLPLAKDESVPGLVQTIEGHTHDVMELKGYRNGNEDWVASASIDGSLRRWKWPEMLEKQVKKGIVVPVREDNLLTEEEERELEELMAED